MYKYESMRGNWGVTETFVLATPFWRLWGHRDVCASDVLVIVWAHECLL